MPDSVPTSEVAGDYTVSLTNGANSCTTVTGWSEGAVNSGIHFTITQDGSKLTAEADGDAAVYFILLTGSNEFVGSIHGNAFVLTDYGPTVSMAGNCTYTVNAVVSGTVDGDTISGTVTYRPVIGSDPDCSPYDCEAKQVYEGTRPAD
jgi:hypothetical protein